MGTTESSPKNSSGYLDYGVRVAIVKLTRSQRRQAERQLRPLREEMGIVEPRNDNFFRRAIQKVVRKPR